MELLESQPLLEWLANNYKSFGATLEIITDKSQEGSQFVRGFGGIGGKFLAWLLFFDQMIIYWMFVGILRYKIDIQNLQGDTAADEFDDYFDDY